MSKTKTPLLSFGAQGTIGDVLTAQRRGSETLLRQKPIPTYRRTLPQQYQRWLYKDYVYLWHKQSAETQREYAAAGVRFHLTGFQYWMKYHLTNLPDIIAGWHLDETRGAIAYDSGKNAHHGTIFGASPVTGTIAGAYHFDGVNDRILIPVSSLLHNIPTFTIECFLTPYHASSFPTIFNKEKKAFLLQGTTLRLYAWVYAPTIALSLDDTPLALNTRYHVALTYDDTGDRYCHIIKNGVEVSYQTYKQAVGAIIDDSAFQVRLGNNDLLTHDLNGILDHLFYYNRVLDSTTLLRHSKRRYPS